MCLFTSLSWDFWCWFNFAVLSLFSPSVPVSHSLSSLLVVCFQAALLVPINVCCHNFFFSINFSITNLTLICWWVIAVDMKISLAILCGSTQLQKYIFDWRFQGTSSVLTEWFLLHSPQSCPHSFLLMLLLGALLGQTQHVLLIVFKCH